MSLSLIKDHQHVWYKPPGLSRQQITGTAQDNAAFTKNTIFMGINQQSVMNCTSLHQLRTCRVRISVCLPLNILLMTMGLSP